MPRFTANIAFLFAELPFLDRIEAAKRAGFDLVECHFPYEFPVAELKARLDGAGVRLTGLNTRPSDGTDRSGEWGRAGAPGREEAFARDFDDALRYATELGASVIHVMAANVDPDERPAALRTYVANLRWAARQAAGTGITLVLEPLNRRDMPRYLVAHSDEMVGIIAEIGEPNVKLLFDAYHVQIMEGDLICRFARHLPHVGHVQIAAVPSRAEPDEGEIHVVNLLKAVDASGYSGLVGLEYKPRAGTQAGLRWMTDLGLR